MKLEKESATPPEGLVSPPGNNAVRNIANYSEIYFSPLISFFEGTYSRPPQSPQSGTS